MRSPSIILLAALSLLVASSACAQGITAANAAFDRNDYSRAFELYEPLAKAGDASAQSAIGAMYYFGEGVAKNWNRAYMWFSLAAKSTSATGIVARTNRDVIKARMQPADIELSQSMADQCLASHYRQCGLLRYAGR